MKSSHRIGLIFGLTSSPCTRALLLTTLRVLLAQAQRIAPRKVILEHLLIALCAVELSYYVGDWVHNLERVM
jgi:hypothetical protein